MLTAIVANVAVPCLILGSLTKLTIDARSFGVIALGTLAIACTGRLERCCCGSCGFRRTRFTGSQRISVHARSADRVGAFRPGIAAALAVSIRADHGRGADAGAIAAPQLGAQWGLSLLGGMAVSMMLMALGVSLAGLGIVTLALSVALAALRLAIGFGTGLGSWRSSA